jgi:phospho-N-acetylmuramoyl-pentapeptide-transferase
MLLWLIGYLQHGLGWNVPAVFSYCSTRMILAAGMALCVSILMGPWFIRKLYEQRIGQPIRKDDCPMLAKLHEKKEDTPTMGGVLILFSMLLSLVLFMNWAHAFTWILAVGTVVLGGLGGYDDWLKLRYRSSEGLGGRYKLAVQAALALGIASYLLLPGCAEFLQAQLGIEAPYAKDSLLLQDPGSGVLFEPLSLSTHEYAARVYLPFYKYPLLTVSGLALGGLGLLFAIVITGSSNAVNLTDGLDGLAAGCVIMVAATLGAFAFVSNHTGVAEYLQILYIDGSGEVAVYMSAVAGACLGFLWYNGHPAQVFMGDTGSLALGGVIGIAAVLIRRELLLALIGGVFVMEALSVMIQVASFRFRQKKRVFLCAPIHHHFEYKGWHEVKVVLRFWIISLLLALAGVASLKFQ